MLKKKCNQNFDENFEKTKCNQNVYETFEKKNNVIIMLMEILNRKM